MPNGEVDSYEAAVIMLSYSDYVIRTRIARCVPGLLPVHYRDKVKMYDDRNG